MHKTGGLIVGVLTLMAAISAQAQVPQGSGTLRVPTTQPPYVLPGEIVPPGDEGPRALGTIDGLPLRVWTPVPPPYDAMADRTGAANPFPIGPD